VESWALELGVTPQAYWVLTRWRRTWHSGRVVSWPRGEALKIQDDKIQQHQSIDKRRQVSSKSCGA